MLKWSLSLNECIHDFQGKKKMQKKKVSFSLLYGKAMEYDGAMCGDCYDHSDSWRKLRFDDVETSSLPGIMKKKKENSSLLSSQS